MAEENGAAGEVWVEVAGKKVDVARALPWTIGDARALKKRGVDISRLDGLGDDPGREEKMFVLTEHVIQKLAPEVTVEQVEAISLVQMGEMWEHLGEVMRTTPTADPTS